MGEPKTNGVLRTDLKKLKVGDYILVHYCNGEFKFNYNDPEITAVSGLEDGKGTGTSYFIKVDTGLLVSDRPIIHATKVKLNSLNFYNSNNTGFRIPTYYEFAQFATSDLNGTIIPSDADTWHYNYGSYGAYNENYYGNGAWDWEHNNGTGETSIREEYRRMRPNRFVYEYVDNPKSTNFFF